MTVRKKRKPAKTSNLLPGWAWLGVGMIAGIAIAMTIDIDGWFANQSGSAKHETAVPTEPSEKREFDFYTLLPELEIIIPQEETTPLDRQPVKPAPAASQGSYLLQAGSFKRLEEADSLKARLALLGIESNIQSVNVDNTTWHRVRIGPSKDRPALEKTRKHLSTNHIDTILMQTKQ